MRCNLIFPWFLTDQHLIAERRELRMIPPLLKKRLDGWYRYCGKPVDERWVSITYPIPYFTGD